LHPPKKRWRRYLEATLLIRHPVGDVTKNDTLKSSPRPNWVRGRARCQ